MDMGCAHGVRTIEIRKSAAHLQQAAHGATTQRVALDRAPQKAMGLGVQVAARIELSGRESSIGQALSTLMLPLARSHDPLADRPRGLPGRRVQELISTHWLKAHAEVHPVDHGS